MSFHHSNITIAAIYEFLLMGTSCHLTYRDLQSIWNGVQTCLELRPKESLRMPNFRLEGTAKDMDGISATCHKYNTDTQPEIHRKS